MSPSLDTTFDDAHSEESGSRQESPEPFFPNLSDEDDPTVPTMFPYLSTFIRFSIDPMATVEGVDDPEVQRAAREMKSKQYIGYVHQPCSWDRSQPYVVYELILVGRGLAEPNYEKGIEPYMCMPISSTTNNCNHPNGREPLKTNQPFPFDDCYTYGAIPPTKVRMKSEERHYADAILLSSEEHARDQMFAEEDAHRQDELMAERGFTPPGCVDDGGSVASFEMRSCGDSEFGLGEGGGVENTHSEDDKDVEPNDQLDPETNGHLEEGNAITDEDIIGLVAMMVGNGIATDNMTMVKDVSYDISSCTDFGQPDEFFKEKWYLQEAKERAIERAKQIDAQMYEAQPVVEPLGGCSNHEPSTKFGQKFEKPRGLFLTLRFRTSAGGRSIAKGWNTIRRTFSSIICFPRR